MKKMNKIIQKAWTENLKRIYLSPTEALEDKIWGELQEEQRLEHEELLADGEE